MARFVVHTEHRQFRYNHKKNAELCAERFIALRVSPIVRIERCERADSCEEIYRWEVPGFHDEPPDPS